MACLLPLIGVIFLSEQNGTDHERSPTAPSLSLVSPRFRSHLLLLQNNSLLLKSGTQRDAPLRSHLLSALHPSKSKLHNISSPTCPPTSPACLGYRLQTGSPQKRAPRLGDRVKPEVQETSLLTPNRLAASNVNKQTGGLTSCANKASQVLPFPAWCSCTVLSK